MSNEWKELDIANLPPDILVGDYVFERVHNKCHSTGMTTLDILHEITVFGYKYRYRKPEQEPKAPSHEEIMTKWWSQVSPWVRVQKYDPSISTGRVYQLTNGRYVDKSWFTGRESADIPPEEDK